MRVGSSSSIVMADGRPGMFPPYEMCCLFIHSLRRRPTALSSIPYFCGAVLRMPLRYYQSYWDWPLSYHLFFSKLVGLAYTIQLESPLSRCLHNPPLKSIGFKRPMWMWSRLGLSQGL